jgi:hypothetical protein
MRMGIPVEVVICCVVVLIAGVILVLGSAGTLK